MPDTTTQTQEVMRASGKNIPISKEVINVLQKYLRLIPTIDPHTGKRIWMIATVPHIR